MSSLIVYEPTQFPIKQVEQCLKTSKQKEVSSRQTGWMYNINPAGSTLVETTKKWRF